MECTNVFSARVVQRRARAIGGIKMSILGLLRSCRRTAGLPIQEYVCQLWPSVQVANQ
jgi:hypothetical protein